MKTLVYSISPFEKPLLDAGKDKDIELQYQQERLTKETASLAKGHDAVSIFSSDKASAEVLQALKDAGVKYLSTRTMGVDHIDIDKAKELDLKVANVPHYSPYSVAEHSIALMLALNRQLIRANTKVRNFNFLLNDLVGFDMNGKTVGLVGAGEIGAVSAKILNGLGCKLMIFDIKENQDLIDKYDAKYVDIDKLCKKSDIISIHAPLTDDTKHLIDKEKIDLMKEGVMIINTARGPICKTEALIDGLKSGKIGYLGMDVYEYEKGLFFENHSNDIIQDDLFIRLMGFKNVLITAHQAFLTREAIKEDMDNTLKNLKSWANNQTPENELS